MGLLDLDGPRLPPASGGAPDSLVVLLHGLGADGNDLIGLAPYWARALPRTAFASPHAPFPCDMAPMGRQWFSLQEREPHAILAGVQAAAPILDAFRDEELARHKLTADRLALVGFSQGTMMSLHVAPRRREAVACVVGYSGALVGADALAAEIVSRPPVLLVHGDADPVVPFAALAAAETGLRAAGVAVMVERRPGLPHSIDEVGLVKGGQFLAGHLAARAPAVTRP
jgi:phospholipase/carboxylesterase